MAYVACQFALVVLASIVTCSSAAVLRSRQTASVRAEYDARRVKLVLESLSKNVPHTRPEDLVDRVGGASDRAEVTLEEYQQLPLCDFSASLARFPPWAGKEADWHDKFLRTLNRAGVTAVLTWGTLLGAFRHHGTIPYDEDMDMVFSACDNIGLVHASKSRFSNKSCEELGHEQNILGENEFSRILWKEVLSPLLSLHGINMVDFTHGGLRLSNGGNAWNGLPGGIGVDFLVTASAISEHASPQMCKCTYGSTFAYCSVDTKQMLLDQYGKDFMVPKSQCQYYSDIGHSNWAWRSRDECTWADKMQKEYLESQRSLNWRNWFSQLWKWTWWWNWFSPLLQLIEGNSGSLSHPAANLLGRLKAAFH